MAKTHFAPVALANESNPQDDWGISYCGLEYTESPFSWRIEYVTCKKCLAAYQRERLVSKELPSA